jgi:hypothetical protein
LEKTSNFNDKVTEMYKPIDNAFKMLVSSIGQTFNNSENKYIKNIKSSIFINVEFSKATAATLNNSYMHATNQVIGENEKENKA